MYFNIIWIKFFYIDNIIKKVVCMVFYVYILKILTAVNNVMVINKKVSKI